MVTSNRNTKLIRKLHGFCTWWFDSDGGMKCENIEADFAVTKDDLLRWVRIFFYCQGRTVYNFACLKKGARLNVLHRIPL